MRLKAAAIAAVFAGALFLHYRLLDGISGAVFTMIFGDTTSYASGYTDNGFRAVRPGMTDAQVQELIGQPLGEVWSYVSRMKLGSNDPADPCDFVYIRGRNVDKYVGRSCRKRGIEPLIPVVDVEQIMGRPVFVVWRYSESRVDGSYRERVVYLSNGRVEEVRASFYVD
jgi:hypothetical protein